MRAVIVDGSGVILRTVTASPSILSSQVGVGETAYALADEADAGFIDDVNVKVSAGAFVAVGDYAGPVPDVELVAL